MKKVFKSVLILLLISSCSSDQISDFDFLKLNPEAYRKVGNLANKLSKIKVILEKNPVLYQYLAKYDIISNEDIEKCTNLNLSGIGLKKITGIHFFENLTHLNLSNNDIVDLDPYNLQGLRTLLKLESLDLSNNKIKNIHSIYDLLITRKLVCDSNGDYSTTIVPVTSTYGSFPQGGVVKIIPSIRYLNLKGNPLEDISGFWKDREIVTCDSLFYDCKGFENTILFFNNCSELYRNSNLFRTKINDKALSEIEYLKVNTKFNSSLRCIDGLKFLPNLKSVDFEIKGLDLEGEQVEQLSARVEMLDIQFFNLERFSFRNFPIEGIHAFISKINNPKKINTISIYGAKLIDCNFLECFSSLSRLDLKHNEISTPFPYNSFTELLNLDLSYNNLTSFGLGFGAKLKELNLECNQIVDMPVCLADFQALERLYLRRNPISKVAENLSKLNELPSIRSIYFDSFKLDDYSVLKPLTERKNEIIGLNYFKIKEDFAKNEFLKYENNRGFYDKLKDSFPCSKYRARKENLFGEKRRKK